MWTSSSARDFLYEQSELDELRGTMRLGSHTAIKKPGSLANRLYGSLQVKERHHHR
jgi:CTP synthase